MTLGPPQVPIVLVGTAHVSQASADYTREAILVRQRQRAGLAVGREWRGTHASIPSMATNCQLTAVCGPA
jgi:hypothetical protein